MKATGPNHWTRPPASQRAMLSERMPLERTPTGSVEWWSRMGGHLGAAICVFAMPVALYAAWAILHAR